MEGKLSESVFSDSKRHIKKLDITFLTMKVALIGATGFVGAAVLQELISRGHQVTAIVRHPDKVAPQAGATAVRVNVLEAAEVARAVQGHEAVISAYNPGWTNPNLYAEFLQGADAIQQGVKGAGVGRLLVVGGAGSLYAPDGEQFADKPGLPAAILPGVTAARDYLNVLRKEQQLDWTFFSPALGMTPENSGQRRGTYRTGTDTPVYDAEGHSVLSVEDAAVALVDELESPQYIRARFTAAY